MRQSLANQLRAIKFDEQNPQLFGKIEQFEDYYYQLKNACEDLKEDLKRISWDLAQTKESDRANLDRLSKKINKSFKDYGDDEGMNILLLNRNRIMDHFFLAYIADLSNDEKTRLSPRQVKMIQEVVGSEIHIYFKRYSGDILL